MLKIYQVTLYNPTGEYRPISCLIKREQYSDTDYSNIASVKKELQKEGIKKICEQRRWQLKDLTKYKYTRYRVRAYTRRQTSSNS